MDLLQKGAGVCVHGKRAGRPILRTHAVWASERGRTSLILLHLPSSRTCKHTGRQTVVIQSLAGNPLRKWSRGLSVNTCAAISYRPVYSRQLGYVYTENALGGRFCARMPCGQGKRERQLQGHRKRKSGTSRSPYGKNDYICRT